MKLMERYTGRRLDVQMSNDNNQQKPFIFMQKPYMNIDRLVETMALNWKEGRQAVFSGKIRDHFRLTNKEITLCSSNAEKDFHANSKDGNIIFWKWIYKVSKVERLYWGGKDYGNLPELISLLKKSTLSSDKELEQLLGMLVKEKILSSYIVNATQKTFVVENVKLIEKYYNRQNSRFDRKKLTTLLYVVLSENKSFDYDLKNYNNIKDLSDYLQGLADTSMGKLQSKSKALFLDDYNLNPYFEGWLMNIGRSKEVSLWNDRFQVGKPKGTNDIDEDEVIEDDTMDAQKANTEDFMQDIKGFESEFLNLLTKYPESINDKRQFLGLLKDYFPQNPMQINLINSLHTMEIVKAIKEADSLNTTFLYRFVKKLSDEQGIRKEAATWAVSLWCVSYGERVLGIPCEISI